jgi:XTP/dITP diphosphohydrolase
VPHGEENTFGEMDPAKKHGMSHRSDAFRQLVGWLEKQRAG